MWEKCKSRSKQGMWFQHMEKKQTVEWYMYDLIYTVSYITYYTDLPIHLSNLDEQNADFT